MPYVSSSRFTGSHKSERIGLNGAIAGSGIRADSSTAYEFTYSFRTGRGTALQDKGQPTKLDPLSEVYNPTGNLVDRLAYRKRFIERQIALITTRPGAPTHFLLGDVGHEFGNAKVRITAAENALTYQNSLKYSVKNATPTQYRVFDNATGLLVPATPLLDCYGSFYQSKGSLLTAQSLPYGPSKSAVLSRASNHISEMNPYRAKASVFTTLLELAKGDIPGIMTSLRRHMITIQGVKASGIRDAAQAFGNETLNNVFGWAPIVRDVDRAIKVLLELDNLLFPSDGTRRKVQRVISQRGAIFTGSIPFKVGSPLLGNVTFNAKNPAWNYTQLFGTGTVNTSLITGTFNGTNSVLETYSLWTTARFNTGLRPTVTNNDYLDRAIDLIGLKITPEVLWDLTPWSWLIDWFSNLGTVIGNLSTLGMSNTILNYAYTTARLKTTSSVWVEPVIVGGTTNGVQSKSGHFISTLELDHKLRMAASPFGFDVSLDALSSAQWGILAALGLARSR